MIDHPDAERLLAAMADALDAEVLPALGARPESGAAAGTGEGEAQAAARYTARIVANLSRILAREAAAGPEAAAATRSDLATLLGSDGSLEELVAALDDTLRDDPRSERLDTHLVHQILSANIERRLAIARPGYVHRPSR